jgi:glutaredoxin-like protein
MLQELKQISDKIKLEIYDFIKDKALAGKLGVDKIPAVVVMDDTDYGIKFYGIPAGYEFGSLIEAIKMVSTGETTLNDESKTFLDSLQKDIHLQVFVTPTCPYCQGAVILAHRMAFYSPRVRADMIEATEFPHLSQKYQVMGVPRTVINETVFQEGAAPENLIINKIKSVL